MYIKRVGLLVVIALASCLFVSSCDEEEKAKCGNGKIEGDEQCDKNLGGTNCRDLGHDRGLLACNNDCTYDESACIDCGNDVAEDGEACDGVDLDGFTCEHLGHTWGELACNLDCTFDQSGCCDTAVPYPCEDQTCSGHGTCVLVDCAASCECDAGYIQLDDLVCSESTCAPPDQVPDPWVITFRPYNFETRGPVSEALVEVYLNDGTLLGSGTSNMFGVVQLSIPSGGKPIDGYWVVSKTGYISTRFRIQGGLGHFDNWSSMMAPEPWADEFVQTHWGQSRSPDAALVFLGLFECNQGSEYYGVPGATVSFSPTGLDPVYMSAIGTFETSLTGTTAYGDSIAANVPAGDNTITVRLGEQDITCQRDLLGGTWEVVIAYPRAVGEIPDCAPGDISGYVPEWRPSGGFAQGVCSDQQVVDYFDDCWGSTATSQTCATWKDDPVNADCNACIYVPYDAPNWNALVNYYHLGFVDAAPNQCISAFEGDLSENSCGAKLEAARHCAIYACKNNCPIRPNDATADLAEFNACGSAAYNGVCTSYADEAAACSSGLLGQGDPVDQCLWAQGEEFLVMAERIAILICGDGTVGP